MVTVRSLLIRLIVLLAALQYRLWVGPGSLAEVARLEQRIQQQREENQALSQRNDRLAEEVASLKAGLGAVEERARQELGLIRRGGSFYLVLGAREGGPCAPRSTHRSRVMC